MFIFYLFIFFTGNIFSMDPSALSANLKVQVSPKDKSVNFADLNQENKSEQEQKKNEVKNKAQLTVVPKSNTTNKRELAEIKEYLENMDSRNCKFFTCHSIFLVIIFSYLFFLSIKPC